MESVSKLGNQAVRDTEAVCPRVAMDNKILNYFIVLVIVKDIYDSDNQKPVKSASGDI